MDGGNLLFCYGTYVQCHGEEQLARYLDRRDEQGRVTRAAKSYLESLRMKRVVEDRRKFGPWAERVTRLRGRKEGECCSFAVEEISCTQCHGTQAPLHCLSVATPLSVLIQM